MYIFRADGNARTGAGHIMRCMTIADALARLEGGKEEIVFFCGEEQAVRMASSGGFWAKRLEAREPWTEAELTEWERILRSEEGDQWRFRGSFGDNGFESDAAYPGKKNVILADSYLVTDLYLEKLEKYGAVALLDDFGRHRFPVDCIINYNAPAQRTVYRDLYKGCRTRLAVGREYIPVRAQFVGREYRVRREVRNVLITTGGGDIDNIARRIFERIDRKDREYYVVVGRFSPHLAEMKGLERERRNLHVLYDVTAMGELMEKCDVAVTAGGTTVYELAAVGVPLICFSYAENQEVLTEYIGTMGVAGYAGAYHREPEETLNRLEELFDGLNGSNELRRSFYEAERRLADGRGAERLARVLWELKRGIERKDGEDA
ncbi:MAG: UDP-2,4-diacetamido-2,4,6-trideoxy-beta-L-altropyranose hydrolase [bacterium]|nr:UDP-2,4-diacetamido-2,4,6-trideoxy-beta-L-altropyranose hydrolase [bacterium]